MSFYYKMLGDYYRYLTEFADEDKRNDILPAATEAYYTGTEWAAHLPATHTVRLGLALNYSVFLHEIVRDTVQAREKARAAYDTAAPQVTQDQEDALLTLQLLQDNLNL